MAIIIDTQKEQRQRFPEDFTESQKALITSEMTPKKFYAIIEDEDEEDVFLTHNMRYNFLKAQAEKFSLPVFVMSGTEYRREKKYLS